MIDFELWQLLKGVSRSFYLSVRFLPSRVRPAIALGYLLARASDTIADANSLAATDRLKILSQLRAQLFTMDPSLQRGLKECAQQQGDGAERQLLERVEEILACARRLPQNNQDLLLEVLGRIMRGQILDIERFELASSLHALRSPEELEEYIYLVAGSVGEFWTKLCLQAWTPYSRVDAQKIVILGTEYGKGLQLVNILRDYPQDVRLGRSYLPVTGALSEDIKVAEPLFEEWRAVASRYLESGAQYVQAIRPFRVRFACALPVLIGIETLAKLKTVPASGQRIKVSRGRVYWLMLLSLLIAAVPGCGKVLFRPKS
ncbi:MAG: squalene/phytoene synthase family protein [Verrucomicrobia bacterium]|nr:squalene/phytoene synthase family protein [Verrucomicrobiota bacterium]MBV8279363.1 squalene/phytoene synthase family protein [Verrucomicrobiota bacterium]